MLVAMPEDAVPKAILATAMSGQLVAKFFSRDDLKDQFSEEKGSVQLTSSRNLSRHGNRKHMQTPLNPARDFLSFELVNRHLSIITPARDMVSTKNNYFVQTRSDMS